MIAFGEDISLYEGDCRELLASLPGGSVDAVVTDPPYELWVHGPAMGFDGHRVRHRPVA